MTQDQAIIVLLKAGLIAGIISLLTWVVVYGRLQPWWRDHIGINLVALACISAGQLSFLAISLFWHLNRLNSHVIGWAYTVFTLAITPVMIWRTVVWVRASRKGDGP